MRGNKSKAESYIKLAIERNFKEVEKKVDDNNNIDNKDKDKELKEKEKEKDKEKDKDKTLNNIDTNQEKQNNENKNEENKETKKYRRLISVMNKPINPMIIQAYIFYENGKQHEAISILNKIMVEYDSHDPYVLIFLANIYYEMSIENRSKGVDKDKIRKAIELYFRALEYDKYNAIAAIGLANCLSEFNYVDKALEIYHSIKEQFPEDHNSLINSSFIYMDDKKYEKASVFLRKVLNNLYHGNNNKIENLLGKWYIETKEYKLANKHLKNLIMKYPDNPIYQYNYGILLHEQYQDIISNPNRKYSDTQRAIKIIERALKIFEELSSIRRDDKNIEKIMKKREFIYKCKDMVDVCKVNLIKSKDFSKKDLENEDLIKKKNEESNFEYIRLKEEQQGKEKLLNEKHKETLDPKIIQENNELMEKLEKIEIEEKNAKEKRIKGKKKRKGKKGEEEEEGDYLINREEEEEEKVREREIDYEEEESKEENEVNS